MKRLIIIPFILLFLISLGQSTKINFALKSVIEQSEPDDYMLLKVYGNSDLICEKVEAYSGMCRSRQKGSAVLFFPTQLIPILDQLPEIEHIEFVLHKPQMLNDEMVFNNNVVPVHQGFSPLNNALLGENIIVGIVDAGIEIFHPDFLNENGNTRILALWDHTLEDEPDRIPPEYGYGNVWDQAELNAGISPHQDQIQFFGHGSTVTGAAAGDGSAVNKFAGVAPKSDLVIVSSDFLRPDWTLSIADAVDFIFNVAQAENKPCVVNLSLGSYLGSHDGLDAAGLAISNQLFNQNGRSVICAAGNSGESAPYHLAYELNEDTSFTWFKYNSNTSLGFPGVFFELWADTLNFQNAQFSIGADKVWPNYDFRGQSTYHLITDMIDQVVTDSIFNMNDDALGIVEYWATVRGAQYQLQVQIPQPDSSQYYFRFSTFGEGTFDIWSAAWLGTSDMVLEAQLPSEAEFPEISNYKIPDIEKNMVSSWACSDDIITVANYINRSQYLDVNDEIQVFEFDAGEIAGASSWGPTRDNRQKPDISASGSLTLSTGNFSMLNYLIANEPFKVAQGGMHFRNGGTSMASPVVAGVAALFLEQCPNASHEFIRNAILEHGAQDNYTGIVPNIRWGAGKIDAFGTISQYAIDATVQISDDLLIAGEADIYQWFFNEVEIIGQNESTLAISNPGVYQLKMSNNNGCEAWSDPITYTNIYEMWRSRIQIYPNPVEEIINLKNVEGDELSIMNPFGQVVFQADILSSEMVIDVSFLQSGLYFLHLIDGINKADFRFVKL